MSIHALGELPDGRPYSVMAWADRGSLRDRLEQGPIPVRQAGPLLSQICAGVAVLHDHGIVHRDLTPGNVLFRSRAGPGRAGEQVLIADLGLAKSLAAASGLTARAGTPGYMAPEQDDPLAVVDRRADVYGLGRLGIRLLGAPGPRRPGEPVRLRAGVPRQVAGVLQTATARRPADRYRDAAALGAALDRAVSGHRAGPVARAAAVLLTAAALAMLASDAVGGRFWREPGVAVDPSGRISVRLPPEWRSAAGRWAGPEDAGGAGGPALVVSPDPVRWGADSTVPGAFIWLPDETGTQKLPDDGGAEGAPAAFIAGRPHAGCEPDSRRRSRQAGINWVIAAFTCPDDRGRLVEAAGTDPVGAGLVYVQIAPPAGSGPAFVDTLLAGLRVST